MFKIGDKVKVLKNYGPGPDVGNIVDVVEANFYSAIDTLVTYSKGHIHSCKDGKTESYWIKNSDLQLVYASTDSVSSPSHYSHGTIQPIEFIRNQNPNFNIGCIIKYCVRAGRKDPSKHLEDLQKALVYLQHEIKAVQK